MTLIARTASCLLLATLFSCTAETSIDSIDPEARFGEYNELYTRMQLVGIPRGGGDPVEVPIERLRDGIRVYCVWTGTNPICQSQTPAPTPAQLRYCEALVDECMVHEALDVVRSPIPREYEVSDGQFRSILPPSNAAKVAVLREARGYLQNLISKFNPSQPDLFATNDDVLRGSGVDPLTFAEYASVTSLEVISLLDEIVHQEKEAVLAVADGQFSEHSGLERAARFALEPTMGSRSDFAHRLVGGTNNGLYPFGDKGSICTSEALKDSGAAALEVLRESGISPALIMSRDVTNQQLFEGVTGAGADIGVIKRVADLRNDESIVSVNFPTFLRLSGLSEQDISDARSTFADEVRAFFRPATAPVQRVASLPNLGVSSYGVHESTQRRPVPPPASFYGTLATRGSSAWADILSNNYTYLATMLVPVRAVSTAPTSVTQKVNALKTLALQRMESEFPYYLRLQATATGLRLQINSPRTLNLLTIVHGPQGLQCALQGHVEGQACTLSEYVRGATTTTVIDANDPLTYTNRVMWNLTFGPEDPELAMPYFVVRSRPGAGTPRPGAMEFVAGFFATDPLPSGRIISPRLIELAGSVLTPSSAWCTQFQETCAGIPANQKLPLEDELTEDEGEFESSWRHYLNLAKQAAAEADLLGEKVIQEGLEMDRRAEEAIQEIEELCGVRVNIDGFIASDLSDVVSDVTCTGSGSTCPDLHSCVDRRCVRDPIKIVMSNSSPADKRRLEHCLGTGAAGRTVAVTLGSEQLCYWEQRAGTSNGRPCGLPTGGVSPNCPFPATTSIECGRDGCTSTHAGSACTNVPADKPAGSLNYPLAITTALNFYESNVPGGTSGSSTPPPCDVLRRIRRVPGRLPQFARSFFDPVMLAAQGERIGWEPSIATSWQGTEFGSITRDGAPWLTTGTYRGPSDRWPCAADEERCSNTALFDGLFCTSWNCADPWQRVAANRRLERAVIAARLLVNVDLDPVKYADPESPQDSSESRVIGSIDPVHLLPKFGTEPRPLSPVPVSMWRGEGGQSLCVDAPLGWASCTATRSREGRGNIEVRKQVSHDLWSDLTGRQVYGAAAPGISAIMESASERQSTLRARLTSAQMIDLHPDFRGAQYNPLRQLPWDLNGEDLLDGAELLCEVARERLTSCAEPEVNTGDDVAALGRYGQCMANEMSVRANQTILWNVPVAALDALRNGGYDGAYPTTGGEIAKELTELRRALIRAAELAKKLPAEVQLMANVATNLRLALRAYDIEKELTETRFWSAVGDRVNQCIQASAEAMRLEAGWSGASAAAACANSALQIALEDKIKNLTNAQIDIHGRRAVTEAESELILRAQNISSIKASMLEEYEIIDASLAKFETLRAKATSALNRALLMDSGVRGAQDAVNSVMRRRFNATLARYERARGSAVRMSQLAKKAIEQRLGLNLRDMRSPLTLVDAPARWEAKVCEVSGTDYRKLYEKLRGTTDEGTAIPARSQRFVDDFVGEYVNKLERVVESYRLDFPFQAGTDMAVVSMKNDIVRSRAECEIPVNNLLRWSSQLDVGHDPETGDPIWTERNCAAEDAPCVLAVARTDLGAAGGNPVSSTLDPQWGELRGYDLFFGESAGGELSQTVRLRAGKYMLSWFGAPATGALDENVVVKDEWTGVTLPELAVGAPVVDEVTGWVRRYRLFVVNVAEQDVRISFVKTPGVSATEVYSVAGLMVEDVGVRTTNTPVEEIRPGSYLSTKSSTTRSIPICEDIDGRMFRQGWRRGCLRVCETGFTANCDDRSTKLYCYWERDFTLSLREAERGRQLQSSGFAIGNFNYRVDGIALNFVGSETRRCDGVGTSGCYSNANIQYTIDHLGPYPVRNHMGRVYFAPLFPGRIERARGLAAERYLTNPLSSADRTLIESYVRRELRGRPLEGRYQIRVWEAPGTSFEGIEDIQIMLQYRYWTRFN